MLAWSVWCSWPRLQYANCPVYSQLVAVGLGDRITFTIAAVLPLPHTGISTHMPTESCWGREHSVDYHALLNFFKKQNVLLLFGLGTLIWLLLKLLSLLLQPSSRCLTSILGKSNLQFAGMTISLTISTSSLNLLASDCKQVRTKL